MKKMLLCFIASLALGNAAFSFDGDNHAGESSGSCLKLGADETLGTHYAAFEKLITLIYDRAGLCAQSVAMAPKRIEQLMKSGELDGDWFRPSEYIATRGLEQQVVPQALFGLEARLIWLKDKGFSGNAQDLKGMKVGYRSGFRWLETHIPLMGGIPFAVPGGSQVKALLNHGRIDIYATSSVHALNVVNSFGEDASTLMTSHWATEPFYHLLQSRHADKIGVLNTTIQSMIKSGDLAAQLTMPGIVPVPLVTQN